MTHARYALLCSVSLISLLSACGQNQTHVIASTATVIGVELGQGEATATVSGTIGYKRAEFALVPTNKAVCSDAQQGENPKSLKPCSTGQGARDSANVLMELRYQNILSSEGGIYQRLAVGDAALSDSVAAALLFARKPDGTIDASAAQIAAAVSKSEADLGNKVDAISRCLADGNGKVRTEDLQKALDAAAKKNPVEFSQHNIDELKKRSTVTELKDALTDTFDGMVPALYESLPEECRTKGSTGA